MDVDKKLKIRKSKIFKYRCSIPVEQRESKIGLFLQNSRESLVRNKSIEEKNSKSKIFRGYFFLFP